MESIERLRKMDDEMLVPLGNGQYAPDHSHNDIADEIEAEIAEKYMELPKDADGVSIHIGDRVLEIDGADPDEVTALFLRGYEWQVEGAYICCDADKCKHDKPRTLEDILLGLLASNPWDGWNDIIEKSAAEIRELLEVSE